MITRVAYSDPADLLLGIPTDLLYRGGDIGAVIGHASSSMFMCAWLFAAPRPLRCAQAAWRLYCRLGIQPVDASAAAEESRSWRRQRAGLLGAEDAAAGGVA